MTPLSDPRIPKLDIDGILSALGIAVSASSAVTRYTAILGRHGPRWLFPHRSHLAETILGEWRPYGMKGRLLWTSVRMAARLGIAAWLPGTARAILPADAGKQLLAHFGIESGAIAPVILVGNTVATRKLLVFLENPADGSRSVFKVPLTAVAAVSIRNEVEILRKLDGRYRAPRLLHFSEDAGAAMQEYLDGKLGTRRCKPEYIRLLLGFIQSESDVSLHDRRRHLAARLHNCPAYVDNAREVDALLGYLEADTGLPSALVHGDFAPWNIRELPSGECTLIDWELARWGGIPLFDLCHFYYMQCLLFAPEKLFYLALLQQGAWKEYCRPLGIPPALLPRLGAAFLLEMLAGYWETDDPVASFGLQQISLFLRQIRKPGQ